MIHQGDEKPITRAQRTLICHIQQAHCVLLTMQKRYKMP